MPLVLYVIGLPNLVLSRSVENGMSYTKQRSLRDRLFFFILYSTIQGIYLWIYELIVALPGLFSYLSFYQI